MKRALVLLLMALVAGLTAHAVTAGQAGGERSSAVPHRIISLSPTATETLFAIGAGSQVIAVDDQSDYPKTAPRTSLSGFTPNVEAIAAYRPDLVIISYSPKGFAESLAKASIRVLLQGPASTFAGVYAQMLELGRLTGHVKGATALVKGMKARIAALLKAAPRASLSVYNELTPDYYSATSASIIGAVLQLFGLRNIADRANTSGAGAVQLSAESIVAANPDLIVLADTRCCGQSRSKVIQRPGWSTISGIRKGAIVVIDDSIASRWGPRLVNFVNAVSSALRTISAR